MIKKIKRTFSSVLPVAKNRQGMCIGCGECCRLPFDCPFLKEKDDGSCYCSIYTVRTLNCRKYPRSETEFVTQDTCGYRFLHKTG